MFVCGLRFVACCWCYVFVVCVVCVWFVVCWLFHGGLFVDCCCGVVCCVLSLVVVVIRFVHRCWLWCVVVNCFLCALLLFVNCCV